MTKAQLKLVGYACIAILVVGWFIGKHYATSKARDTIQGYLIRNDLTRYVTYSDISANLFGTATIYDVKIDYGPNASARAKSCRISDVHFKNDQLASFAIAARGVNVPIVAFARGAGADSPLREWVSLGFTSLTGDTALRFDYDAGRGELSASTSGAWTGAGSWRMSIRLDNLDQTLVYNLSHPTSALVLSTLNDPSALIASLAKISLAEADLTIDDSGLRARDREIIDAEVPGPGRAHPKESIADVDLASMRTDLVKAGMAPSEADQMSTTVASWYADGGRLKFSTHLAQPLTLIPSGPQGAMYGPPRLAFDSLATFLVVTKAEISH